MKPINLARQAVGDIEEIGRYTLNQWGDAQRTKYLNEIETTFLSLRDMPGLGRERHDISEGLRSYPVESHVIYYRESEDELRIIRILHQGMLPIRHLERDDNNST